MDCKSCKNYESAERKKYRDIAEQILKLAQFSCMSTPCSSCTFKNNSDTCRAQKIVYNMEEALRGGDC